jgi:4-aminobutyrate aminotransferase-like enzyme
MCAHCCLLVFLILFLAGIGNCIPLDAVTTPKIAKVLTHRYYFNFGGNPICIDVGLAVLKVIIEKSEVPIERGP